LRGRSNYYLGIPIWTPFGKNNPSWRKGGELGALLGEKHYREHGKRKNMEKENAGQIPEAFSWNDSKNRYIGGKAQAKRILDRSRPVDRLVEWGSCSYLASRKE